MAYLTSKTGKKVAKIEVERDHGTEKNVYLTQCDILAVCFFPRFSCCS